MTCTRSCLPLLVALAAAAAPPPVAGDAALVLDVPQLPGIAVDGDTADWADRGLRLEILTPNRPPRAALDDFDGRAALGWDERGVLVRARVTDNQIVEAEQRGSLWNGDGMELFLAPAPGATDILQFAVAPGVSPAYPASRWFMYDYRQSAALKGLAGEPEVAARRTAEGYDLEVLVPWAPLGI
ncbi:MAG: sugar-binding protein, partial [Gemmatimonadota bacterium]